MRMVKLGNFGVVKYYRGENNSISNGGGRSGGRGGSSWINWSRRFIEYLVCVRFDILDFIDVIWFNFCDYNFLLVRK